MKDFFQKFLSFLRVRATAAGLEVSDQVLRLTHFDGKEWQMHAVRLEPGVLESGHIKDRAAFLAALANLKADFLKKTSKKKKINVVVALSSLNIFMQVFNLPVIEASELEKAVTLNLQMLSPIDAAQAYSGWQMVGRNEKDLRDEILAAFTEKAAVDDLVAALLEAGFISVAAESRALSLIRMLRERGGGIDIKKSYLVLNVDNSGIDFLIMRNGQLYFEYTNKWKDMMDDKGQISIEKFRMTLVASFRQVTNFYSQHWPEPLSGVILSAAAFEDEVISQLNANFPLPIARIGLSSDQPIPSEWFVALGCGLRGLAAERSQKEITLLGEGEQEAFRKEQLLSFMAFWRVLFPVALGLLILVFGTADAFLMKTKSAVSASSFTVNPEESQQIDLLEHSATVFNQSVDLLAEAEGSLVPKNGLLTDLADVAQSSGVTISRLNFSGVGTSITLSGTAPKEANVISFKTALTADPNVSNVNLPPTNVVQGGNGYSFSVTFSFNFPNPSEFLGVPR